MATREQFSDEEWAQVSTLPGLVIMAATMADGHLMPSVREVSAGAKALAQGAASHPENGILTLLASSPSAPDKNALGPKVESAEQLVGALEVEITEAVGVLRANLGTEELGQITEALTASARAVVDRLSDGFMGSGTEKVDAGEAAFMDRLATILG